MGIRPKILTRVTIPSGGWDLRVSIDNAGAYDQDIDVTLAAGDYYVSFDGQSDDFVHELTSKVYTGFTTSGRAAYDSTDLTGKLVLSFTDTGKVVAIADGGVDIRIDWTVLDGASIADVLGFDSATTTDLSTGTPTIEGTWQHAYGWYADEDGMIQSDVVEDIDRPITLQSRSVSGKVITYNVASHFDNVMQLRFMTRTKTWSRAIGYTTAPVWPYKKNQALECWWVSAKTGTPFRFYRDGSMNSTAFNETGTATAGDATTLTDSNKAFDIDPFIHKGKIIQMDTWASPALYPQRWHVASHTATVLTVSNSKHNNALNDLTSVYKILNQPYGTYVLDTSRTAAYAPVEVPIIDRYHFRLAVKRFV